MFEVVDNFHDDLMRRDLEKISLEMLEGMKERCILDEKYEIARIVQIEIDSRHL